MKTIYVAVGYYHIGDEHAAMRAIASSLSEKALAEFIEENNDFVGADELEMISYALVDDYGFPFEPREFPVLCPVAFEELSRGADDDIPLEHILPTPRRL